MSMVEKIPFDLTPYSGTTKKAPRPRSASSLTSLFSAVLTPIAQVMEQLALDFESSHTIMDAIQAESVGDVHDAYEVPAASIVSHSEPASSITTHEDNRLDNGSYIELAIKLLLTCAEDLVAAEELLENPASKTRTLRRAQRLKDDTHNWLRCNLPDAPFTFKDCVALLEDELRYQSLDQLTLPDITGRSNELAEWIIEDPENAKHLLGRYRTLFAPGSDGSDDYEFDDLDDDFEDDEEALSPARPRPGA